MKKVLLLLLVFMGYVAFAQDMKPQWTKVLSESPQPFKTQLVSSSENSVKVNVQVPGFYATNVSTPNGEAKVISLPKSVSTAHAGEPDMPMTGIPVMIGDKARMNVRVLSAQYTDFEGIEVAPSKGDFPRTIDPATVPYTYGECYQQNAFFPVNNAELYEPYVIRDFRGQNIAVYPFAYNPVTKTLRVYHDMTIEMYKVDDKGANVIESRRTNVVKMDPDFKSVYQRHFINYEAGTSKYTPVDEEGDLLIICYDNFLSTMTDFVNWKKTRGLNTTIVGTSAIGSSITYAKLKTYIQNQYNANNNLTHVLLVGDVAQIPGYSYTGASTYAGLGDNPYGQVVGNDIYNDLFIGRFSAQNVAQVKTQVQRVITYERDLTTSDTWCQNGEGIGKTEGNASLAQNGEDDYQHIELIRGDLMDYGYNTVYQDYENTSGYTCSASTMSNHFNSGVGIANYCNHGSYQLWGVAYYSNEHVNALTNENKLPFIWSTACYVGKYDNTSTSYGSGTTVGQTNDCFAEAWMHATNSDKTQPTGAIGVLMSYISQPWQPPMWGQDECVDILVESYNSNIKHTWGGTSINGIMGIFDQYSTSETSAVGTYQSWVLYGDPSMMLRTKTPQAMNVSHAGSIAPGTASYSVSVNNGNGALATITDADHNIIGRATVNNGTANINISGNLTPGNELTLCVFGYNKVTYLGTISVVGSTQYDITCTQPQHGSVSAPAKAYANTTVTLTAIPATGYCLSSWTVKDANNHNITVTDNQFTMPESNVTVTASFAQAMQVTLASVSNGTISANLEYALQGNTVILTATPASGYELDKWVVYKTGDENTTVTVNGNSFTMPNYPVTVSAVFVAPQFVNVTIGSGTSTSSSMPINVWYKYTTSQQIYTAEEMDGAGTITAIQFNYEGTATSGARTFDVYLTHTVSSSLSTWVEVPSDSKVYSGTEAFTEAGWYTITLDTPFEYDGTSNLLVTVDDNTGNYSGTSNRSFYTYYTGATRALYLYSDSYNQNPVNVQTGSSYKASTSTSNNQIIFTKEMSNGGSQGTVTQYTITATANPTAGGTVTGAGTYNKGTTATLKATAKSGYEFVSWTKNGSQVSTNATYSFTVNSNAAYVANFEEEEVVVTYYDVTVADVNNGTVTANKTSAAEGETVTLTATPATGYSFDQWVVYETGDEDNTIVVNNNSFTMPAYDVTVDAVFTADQGTGTSTTETLTLGSGSSSNSYLPTNARYSYSFTEQIYTAAEIGEAGTITAIAFKVANAKSATRNIDLYMKHTTKTAFSSKKGWETMSSTDKVFSGNVTFNSSGWTTIVLDTPFEYNGTSNLVVGVDDNTSASAGTSSKSPKFYAYATGANRALRVFNNSTNFNPASPSSYRGSFVTYNNQIQLTITSSGEGRVVEPMLNTSNAQVRKAIDLYPNPAERGASVHFNLSDEMNLDGAKVEVFNTLGVMVYSGQLIGNEVRNDFATGMYTVIVTSKNNDVYYGKLVVR